MKRYLSLVLLASLGALAQEPVAKEAPTPAAAPTTEKTTRALPVGKPYLAAKEAKVFHRERCKEAQDLKKDPAHVEFTWKAEAEQAGYKACEGCIKVAIKAKVKVKTKA